MNMQEMKAIVAEKIRKGEPIHGFMREIAIEIALDEMEKEGA